MLRSCIIFLSASLFEIGVFLPTIHAGSIEDDGWWSAVFAQGDIEWLPGPSDRWRSWFDGHARFHDDANGFNVSIVRPGIAYKLTDNTTVWAGYGWIRTNPSVGLPTLTRILFGSR